MTYRNLGEIARALGGEVSGGQVIAPGPGHSKRDRSLAIKPRTNGDVLVHSHAGDDKAACLNHVRDKLQIVKEPRREGAVYPPFRCRGRSPS
jgi:putative DNA primase/helicase